ncbi:MAG: TetR/AcrR family transcriptional regulator [Proteobacteria bacterium]|nr:TetR/AcrR family transcriptional regulator [Pseudomonadota bacterium]
MTKRLSRKDWLDHGLKVLACDGAEALKAEPLAKSLGVSRGSFYWHFKDMQQFHQVLLSCYQLRTTDETITELDEQAEPGTRLALLLQRAMSLKGRLERAVRSWATWNSDAAAAVERVDKTRLDYLIKLLISAGVPEGQAWARASFIYWAYIGRVMMAEPDHDIPEADLAELTHLLQS